MRIKITGFQILTEIDFEVKGITLISGRTNSGKSSVFRAICSACFGRGGSDYVNHKASQAVVSLSDENTWTFRRTSSEPNFYLDSNRFRKTGGKPPSEYAETLKIPALKVGKSVLHPNFIAQFDPLFILGMTGTEAAACLSFLFSADKFPQLLKFIAQSLRENKSEAKATRSSIETTDERIQQVEKQLKELESLRTHFDKIPKLVESSDILDSMNRLVFQFTELKTEEKEAGAEYDDAISCYNRFKQVDAELYEKYSALKLLTQDVEGLENDIKQAEVDLEGLKTKTSGFADLDESHLQQYQDALRLYQELDKFVLEATSDKENLKKVKVELMTVGKQLSVTQKELKQCPYCSSELNDETKQILLNREGEKDE